jgi:hypothetical protein
VQTFKGAKVGMDWLLVVEGAKRPFALKESKRSARGAAAQQVYYVRPGMVCVRVQGRRVRNCNLDFR